MGFGPLSLSRIPRPPMFRQEKLVQQLVHLQQTIAVERDGVTRAQNVFDNLTYQKKLPVIVHVLVSPGTVGDKAMRSIEYDLVSDQYDRFLNEELLPEVYAKYNIRRDAYSHAIAGNSSGGICSMQPGGILNCLAACSPGLERLPAFSGNRE